MSPFWKISSQQWENLFTNILFVGAAWILMCAMFALGVNLLFYRFPKSPQVNQNGYGRPELAEAKEESNDDSSIPRIGPKPRH